MDRVKTGSIDFLIEGGVPKGSTTIVMGSFGTGKTTFGIQFLAAGAKEGENGILILVDKRLEDVLFQSEAMNIPLRDLIEDGKIKVLSMSVTELRSFSQNLVGEIRTEIESNEAKRVFIDPFSFFSVLHTGDIAYIKNLTSLVDFFGNEDVTCLLAFNASVDYDMMEEDDPAVDIATGMISLEMKKEEDGYKRVLHVLKMMATKHSLKTHEFVFDGGIKIIK